MRLGLAIRVLREAKELGTYEASQKAHISPSLWSMIESGKKLPSTKVMGQIAKVLHIPPEVLFIIECSGMTTSNVAALKILHHLYAWDKAYQDLVSCLSSKK